MRTNVYKQMIVALLQKKHLLTIAELHKAIPSADYSTVFRNVEQLLDTKQIRKVMIDNKSVAYESSKDSHDHFICNDCGTVESIHISDQQIKQILKVEQITQSQSQKQKKTVELTKPKSTRVVSDITVRGVCGACVAHESPSTLN